MLLFLGELPIPSELTDFSIDGFDDLRPAVKLATLFYTSHFAASSALGATVAVITRLITAHTRMSTYPDSWDVFARKYVMKHWVVVTLTDGTSFAGMLEKADTSVQRNERDVVLLEPALYKEEDAKYITMPYQYLYLPGALIASIGIYYNPKVDPKRVVPVHESLFAEPEDDAEE